MSDAEKLEIIHRLVEARFNACHQSMQTGRLFDKYNSEPLYEQKCLRAEAVSSFCLELLDIIAAMNKED